MQYYFKLCLLLSFLIILFDMLPHASKQVSCSKFPYTQININQHESR